ncbi:MAG: hypothetical protein K0V04_34885 [Deltaproteobacteria bacterium]|nr:hypothetical protein [Deltaproteobacteria bacterium]
MRDDKSILFERHGKLILLVHGRIAPTKEEWAQYVTFLQEAAEQDVNGLLVLTDGVGPDSTQRRMVSSIELRTAVVTHSRIARGIVTALSWMGANIQAFALTQIDDSLGFLNVPADDHLAIARRLAAMRLAVIRLPLSPAEEGSAEVVNEIVSSSLDALAKR